MKATYRISPENVDEGWQPLLQKFWNKHGKTINDALIDEGVIYPPEHEVFEAFKLCKYEELKVCILGMDPYINKGEAHGLAFSMKQGEKKKCPPSLNNIFKELHRQHPDRDKRKDTDLTDWAKQGVLLLNTALTVREHKSGSHVNIWKPFIIELFSEIAFGARGVVFILWGNHAKAFEELINARENCILKHSHPSPLSRKPFVGNGHFQACNEYLMSVGKKPIDWL